MVSRLDYTFRFERDEEGDGVDVRLLQWVGWTADPETGYPFVAVDHVWFPAEDYFDPPEGDYSPITVEQISPMTYNAFKHHFEGD